MNLDDLNLYDNTRLTDFMCPRYFYFRHELGWHEGPGGRTKDALAFGSAWHDAMDKVWEIFSGDPTENEKYVLEVALKAWEERWQKEGWPLKGETLLKTTRGRTPLTAKKMLEAYINERRALFTDPTFKLLAIEKPFAVPLDPDRADLLYCGRLDKVFELNGSIYIGEHKTTTAGTYTSKSIIRPDYKRTYEPNSQIDGYLYAANILFDGHIAGAFVDAALIHRSNRDFDFIPVERAREKLDAWRMETLARVEAIEMDRARKPSLGAFRKETSKCWDYRSLCQFHELCKNWSSPFDKRLPAGFVVSRWSPAERLGL